MKAHVHLEMPSPIGPLTIVADGESITGITMHPQSAELGGAATADPANAVLRAARAQLAAYFAGELRSFSLPLAPRGTPFQESVWALLARIPFGETRSYGDLATALGRPGAARAVGAANRTNRIAIVLPCHRVIGQNGTLTGYAGGLTRKSFLLDHEARIIGAQRQTSLQLEMS